MRCQCIVKGGFASLHQLNIHVLKTQITKCVYYVLILFWLENKHKYCGLTIIQPLKHTLLEYLVIKITRNEPSLISEAQLFSLL